MNRLPPLRREVLVEADPAFAFEVFTEEIASWWPVSEFSVYGGGATVCFQDGRIVERSSTGEEAVWGSITDWRPGEGLSFTWHPGRAEGDASAVTVSFHGRGERTLVVLEHTGWEAFADPQAARSEYEQGWPAVLASFAEGVAAGAPWTWVALVHTPATSASEGTSVFDDPRFAEHVAFLHRMNEKGYLVAAGPIGGPGSGMTVLRLPGERREEDAARLATEDDESVRSGLFTVEVRPWNVMLHGLRTPAGTAR